MILLTSTDSLQVLLAGAVAANQGVLYAAFVDVDAASFAASAAGNSSGVTNNTTAVSWCAASASGKFRQIKYLSLYNADTASITATVRVNDGTNNRTLVTVTLAPGERIAYVDGHGFTTFNAAGQPSLAIALADNVVTNAKLADVATATFKGRTSAGTGDPEDMTVAQAAALLQGDGMTAALCGTRGIVVTSKSANYTVAAADCGSIIYHPVTDTTARTWTLPANGTLALPVGFAVTFDNDVGAGILSIAITTDTLVWVGNGSTGTRSIAAGGQATAVKVTPTRWRIAGTGLS
jgi:hypothetical protein